MGVVLQTYTIRAHALHFVFCHRERATAPGRARVSLIRGFRASLQFETNPYQRWKMNAAEIDVEQLIAQMAVELSGRLEQSARHGSFIVGIRSGGVWVAERLRAAMGATTPLGTLNINFYRDDFTRIGMHPRVEPSELPFAIEDQHIVLVDDVLHTGRTIRAALNEIFDYGRPASVMLAVLAERSGREIPIQPDVLGASVDLQEGDHVKLIGPDPLRLVTQQKA